MLGKDQAEKDEIEEAEWCKIEVKVRRRCCNDMYRYETLQQASAT